MSDLLEIARKRVEANPEDIAARSELARLLFEAGQPREAQEQYAAILQRSPADLDALRGAANAAVRAGDAARAEGYLRLLAALGDNTSRKTEKAERGPVELTNRPPNREEEEEQDDSCQVERPTVTLADVGGMEAVKRRLNASLLGPLRNPELRKMYGASLRGGLLLFGPPGCGKTFIARALAGELGARFISVGLADVLDMWLGQSERHLHAIFESARRQAPVVIFFDEIDALGQKRSQLRQHAGRNVVNQLLAELDGADRDNTGLYILGATNHPWDVDTALLRPGRFDRRLLVLPPDQPAREAILGFHLRDRPTRDIDLRWLASRTDGFSGADLWHLCVSAGEFALEASVAQGTPRPIDMTMFRQALKEIKPSTTAWFDIARNFALFANDDGAYDELLAYMRSHNLA